LGTALAEGAYKALVKLEKKPDAKRVPKGKVSTFDRLYIVYRKVF
jgi:hypothetical protein